MRFKSHPSLFFNYTQFARSSMVKRIKMFPREMVNRREAYLSHMYLKRIHHLHMKDFESMSIDFPRVFGLASPGMSTNGSTREPTHEDVTIVIPMIPRLFCL